MKRYSVLHAPLLCFFSKALYQDVARNWTGANLLYLFLLLVLCWVPVTLRYRASFARFLDEWAVPFADQFPTLHIRDGVVSIDEPEPYLVREPKSGKVIAIFDTTGQTTSLEGTEAVVLVTASKIIVVQEQRHKTETYDLSSVKEFDLTREQIKGFIAAAKRWFFPVSYALLLIGSYVYRVVQALLYALAGLIFASLLSVSLGYAASMRLAIVATTPAILLDTIKALADVKVPGWWLLCFVLAMAYLFFGVKWAGEVPPEEPAEAAVPVTLEDWPPPPSTP